MARRYFVVAFRALHHARKESELHVEVVSGRSALERERVGLEDLKLQLTAEDGWSDWIVNVQSIPSDIIDRVVWEARCWDQTGVSRLYGIAVVAIDPQRDQMAFAAGYELAINETHVELKLEKDISTRFPVAEGWVIVEYAIQEWDVREILPTGRRKYSDSSCSFCRHR